MTTDEYAKCPRCGRYDLKGFVQDDMAIKALEQELCEDAVSRKSVLETIDDCNSDGLKGIFCLYDDGERFKEYIKVLPFVTPTRKKSRWVLIDEESNTWQCLRCKELGKDDYWQLNSGTPADNKMDYCLYCGAEMENEK